MQTAGASFPEAVEQLAGEAGLEVPKPSPRAAEAERQRLDLHGVLDRAQAVFARRLREPAGAAGLAYLRGRGLSDATIARFGLGWSGDGRGALHAELRQAGIDTGAVAGSRAAARPAMDGGPARELYWGRVTFPIRDRRGRLISFGGRTLGDAKPKYINGPDTPLFSKRRTLYALDLAREGVRAGAALMVAEGYMDVIALHQAGFTRGGGAAGHGADRGAAGGAVAARPEPAAVLRRGRGGGAGGGAGGGGGAAAADAGPHAAVRQRCPAGEDPDTLVRRGGPAAFRAAGRRHAAVGGAVRLRAGGQRRGHAGAAGGVRGPGWRRRRDRIPDRTWPASTAARCWTASSQSRRRPGGTGSKGGPAPRAPRFARTAPDAGGDRMRSGRGACWRILLRHPGCCATRRRR